MAQARGYPDIEAYYAEPDLRDLRRGGEDFARLLSALSKLSAYTRDFHVLTSLAQVQSGEGLNPATEVAEVVAFLEQLKAENNTDHNRVYGERFLDGGQVSSLAYRWMAKGWNDSLKLIAGKTREAETVNLSTFLKIAETMILWRKPQFLWSSHVWYVSKQKNAFPRHRAPVGWFAWLPDVISPDLVPSAARVIPMAEGTAIVTSETFFDIENKEAVARANDVELELNEAGLLPTMAELEFSPL